MLIFFLRANNEGQRKLSSIFLMCTLSMDLHINCLSFIFVGLFLVRLDRGGEVFSAPTPDFVLQADDKLIFAGDTNAVNQLVQMEGLRVAGTTAFP